jgi:hypothetical protein
MTRRCFRTYSIFEFEPRQASHCHVLARHGEAVFLQVVDPCEATAATARFGDINGNNWFV